MSIFNCNPKPAAKWYTSYDSSRLQKTIIRPFPNLAIIERKGLDTMNYLAFNYCKVSIMRIVPNYVDCYIALNTVGAKKKHVDLVQKSWYGILPTRVDFPWDLGAL